MTVDPAAYTIKVNKIIEPNVRFIRVHPINLKITLGFILKSLASLCWIELIENDAALLMEELKRSLPQVSAPIDNVFVPYGDTKPTEYQTVNQYGEKSIYVQNNSGNIIIN